MVKLLRCNGALPRVRQRRGLDGRPLYPELVPSQPPPPMPKLILPLPSFSYSAQLVRAGPATVYGTMGKGPDAQRTRCGAQPRSPAPVVAWAPVVCECACVRACVCVCVCVYEEREREREQASVWISESVSGRFPLGTKSAPLAMFAPCFLLGTRTANAHASRTSRPCVKI